MNTIFENIKHIAYEIDKAIKSEDLGYSDRCNSTGDNQLKLDIACDAIIEHHFKNAPLVKAIVSEEKERIVELNPDGEYTVCYDPLDGSSIVDANLSVGSIFGIYRGDELRGETLEAAAYVVYGPRLELVSVSGDKKPRHYRSGPDGIFDDVCEIELNEKGKLNAPGGTQKDWLPWHRSFIESLFMDGYRLRYSGGMVPDLHHILTKKGGIFSYPATTGNPKGKLRTLFEVIPFAKIFEAAGGMAVDDRGRRLMELVPEHIHDTTPCFFGSGDEIERCISAYDGKSL